MVVDYSKALKCAKFSKEVYGTPSQEISSHFTEPTFLLEDTKTDTQGAIFTEGNHITIVFRGSSSQFDWRTNFELEQKQVEFAKNIIQSQIVAGPEQEQIYPYTGESSSGALMHRGFVQAYFSVRSMIHDFIKARQLSTVTVTGHSLGGALAILCALDVQYNFGTQVAVDCYTFGAPKVGNSAFRDSFNRRVPSNFRFVNGMDLVPELPRWWQGYHHVATEFRIGNRFSLNFLSQRFKDHGIDRYIDLIGPLEKR
jgi:triacylglycerol lipase